MEFKRDSIVATSTWYEYCIYSLNPNSANRLSNTVLLSPASARLRLSMLSVLKPSKSLHNVLDDVEPVSSVALSLEALPFKVRLTGGVQKAVPEMGYARTLSAKYAAEYAAKAPVWVWCPVKRLQARWPTAAEHFSLQID